MLLESNFRQAGDPEFLSLLLRLRLGQHTKQDVAQLATLKALSKPPNDCVWLFCLKSSAADKNDEELDRQPGPEDTFEAVHKCMAPYLNKTRATHLLNSATKSLRVLKLRVGARVIVSSNALSSKGVAAGSRGTVLAFSLGWTLKRVAADLSEAFAPGQVLSALSRTRRLRDNFLEGFDESKMLVCPDALSFYSSLSAL
ncbi:hypothetical protein I4F81_001463 [Pyropia yezoensis]|uniref:Uncharacterized protein n=1 Tax=Pyropia yezoensis TaxID=2788 RepID=A0ACC3BLS9_PYRYE|nr:hypothetical protein I4F81_001463 [Neopyropia yezoensis]